MTFPSTNIFIDLWMTFPFKKKSICMIEGSIQLRTRSRHHLAPKRSKSTASWWDTLLKFRWHVGRNLVVEFNMKFLKQMRLLLGIIIQFQSISIRLYFTISQHTSTWNHQLDTLVLSFLLILQQSEISPPLCAEGFLFHWLHPAVN